MRTENERVGIVIGILALVSMTVWEMRNRWKQHKKNHEKSVEEQANEYFPVESDSEKAAGHPMVGAS